MTEKEISKLLSLVLRHKPEVLGINLDEEGWTDVVFLLQRLQAKGKPVSMEKLEAVVAGNDKQRFSFNNDHSRIRANQGHSLPVELNLQPVTPPEVLYHGTAERHVEDILKEGIQRQSRQYVHLSADAETATKVGARHGKPFLFIVRSGPMHQNGGKFYLSTNKVWLTDYVAPEYLQPYTSL